MFCTTLNFTKGRSLGYKNTHFCVKLKNCALSQKTPTEKQVYALLPITDTTAGFLFFFHNCD